MPMQWMRVRAWLFVAGAAMSACSSWAVADPPSRVARLGYISGAVSFSPAGEDDWVLASVNRPLTTGDRLWADAGARTEIDVGGAMLRMSAGTGVSILNLDDGIAQLQLTQGTLNVRVRHLEPAQIFEVDTPNLAFTLRQPGAYRIEVDAEGNATTIVVRNGQGEAYGEDAGYVIDSRQPYRFTGTGLREYQYVDVPRMDDFDRWSSDRDRIYDNSRSARFVSQDVVGYQELDGSGTWRVNATYGNVWVPNRVASDWAPYRDGHWAWVDPWGWTWVDDAPWGFAVSHYGRWANLDGTWGWVPGPMRMRAYYAPALVAFVGGNNFKLAISGGNVGAVAWFPLGPRDVYRPSYAVSRGYFENVNRSNTVINNTVINNYYNNTNVTNVVYANRQVPGAVVAVPTTTFVQAQPVGRSAMRITPAMVAAAPVAFFSPVAPTERSVHGAAAVGGAPPPRVFERPVIARTAPPAAPVGFAAQQPHLTASPGMPLDAAVRKELKPAAAAPARVVNVVPQALSAAPTTRPPPAAPGAKPGEEAGKSDGRIVPPAHVLPVVPATPGAVVAPMPRTAPSQATPPPTAPRAPEQRTVPVAPPPAPPGKTPPQVAPPASLPGATQPQVAPSRIAPPMPAAQVPEPRGKPEQGARPEARVEQRQPPVGAPPSPAPAPLPRAVEQKPIPMPPPPVTHMPPAPQSAVPPPPPLPAPPRQVAPPPPATPQAAQPPRTEPSPPAARPPEARPPAATPKPPPPPSQPAAKAEPHGQEQKPAAGKPDEKKKDGE
jgi:hypothetical protein